MSGKFVHVELNTGDIATAKKFYKKVFGDVWSMKDEEMGPGMTYTMLNAGKLGIGGLTAKMMPEAPTQWLPYVEVENVKKTLAKAEKNGARVVAPYMEIMGGHGAMGIFVDPTGAGLGVWQKVEVKKPAKKKKSKK